MKKFFCVLSAVLCIVLCAPVSYAQDSSEGKVKYGPYLTNKFWDNWSIDAGIGTGAYLGGHNDGNFRDRLGIVYDISASKWIVPGWGARVQMLYTPTFREEIGEDITSFTYFGVHADAMWNMFNSFMGYKEDRFYQLIPIFGGGYSRASNSNSFSGYTNSFMLTFSLLNKFRISEVVDMNVEMRAVGTKQMQDAFSWDNHTFDTPLSLTAGFSIKLGKQTFSRAGAPDASLAEARAAADAAMRSLQDRNDSLANALAVRPIPIVMVEDSALKAENAALRAEIERLKAEKRDIFVTYINLCDIAVFFDKNKSTLTPQEMPSFEAFVKSVRDVIAEGKIVHLTGFADAITGTVEQNAKLCRERCEYVKNLLVNKYGISPGIITTSTKIDDGNNFHYAGLSRCVYLNYDEEN